MCILNVSKRDIDKNDGHKKMMDIFDNKILCKNCDREMIKTLVHRNGLGLRAVVCEKCGEKIIHPADLNNQEKFNDLKGKTFSVKLRMVGNSHAVSIPKEIVEFMDSMHFGMHENMERNIRRHKEEMDRMVRLCLEDFGRLSMNFNESEDEEDEDGR